MGSWLRLRGPELMPMVGEGGKITRVLHGSMVPEENPIILRLVQLALVATKSTSWNRRGPVWPSVQRNIEYTIRDKPLATERSGDCSFTDLNHWSDQGDGRGWRCPPNREDERLGSRGLRGSRWIIEDAGRSKDSNALPKAVENVGEGRVEENSWLSWSEGDACRDWRWFRTEDRSLEGKDLLGASVKVRGVAFATQAKRRSWVSQCDIKVVVGGPVTYIQISLASFPESFEIWFQDLPKFHQNRSHQTSQPQAHLFLKISGHF